MKQGEKIVLHSTLIIVGSYFLFVGLSMAEAFLVPLFTAMVLAFMMLPVAGKMESWGVHKILATLISTILLLIVGIAFTAVLFFQIRSFADDWDEIQDKLEERIEQFSSYLVENTPLEREQIQRYGLLGIDREEDEQVQQQRQLQDQQQQEQQRDQQDQQQEQSRQNQQQQGQEGQGEEGDGGDGGEEGEEQEADRETIQDAGEQAISVVGAIFGFLANVLLTLVYIFFFIYFRTKFKNFILRFFPKSRRDEIEWIISRSASVSRSYLAGRLLLMVFLAILYFTGLAISGLENALFISLLSAALSIIPIVGNFIGYFIALGVAFLTGGEMIMIIGITITFVVAQFIDTYVLQPIMLGDKVDVHPFFIILTVILGNEVWGIMGMVLAIPIFGILTVICRQVPDLNPFGYLFSKNDLSELDEDDKP
jgi:predicted PurR-regulated permease PerM